MHEVSLLIKQGEVVVLLEPSRSGKTTLLNLVGTLEIKYHDVIPLHTSL